MRKTRKSKTAGATFRRRQARALPIDSKEKRPPGRDGSYCRTGDFDDRRHHQTRRPGAFAETCLARRRASTRLHDAAGQIQPRTSTAPESKRQAAERFKSVWALLERVERFQAAMRSELIGIELDVAEADGVAYEAAYDTAGRAR
jgi:hypothetical protein